MTIKKAYFLFLVLWITFKKLYKDKQILLKYNNDIKLFVRYNY